eukprot:sb/3471823/
MLFGRYFFGASVALSTFGALLSIILSFSRLPHVGTMEHMLPSVFGLVSKKAKTPVTSLLFLGFTSVCCVWPSNIGDLIVYVGFLSWIFWGLCFAAVIVLRFKEPHLERPFRRLVVFILINTPPSTGTAVYPDYRYHYITLPHPGLNLHSTPYIWGVAVCHSSGCTHLLWICGQGGVM